jgi:hypothetical protein
MISGSQMPKKHNHQDTVSELPSSPVPPKTLINPQLQLLQRSLSHHVQFINAPTCTPEEDYNPDTDNTSTFAAPPLQYIAFLGLKYLRHTGVTAAATNYYYKTNKSIVQIPL